MIMNDLFWVVAWNKRDGFQEASEDPKRLREFQPYAWVLVVQVSLSLGDLPTGETSQNFGAAIIPEI